MQVQAAPEFAHYFFATGVGLVRIEDRSRDRDRAAAQIGQRLDLSGREEVVDDDGVERPVGQAAATRWRTPANSRSSCSANASPSPPADRTWTAIDIRADVHLLGRPQQRMRAARRNPLRAQRRPERRPQRRPCCLPPRPTEIRLDRAPPTYRIRLSPGGSREAHSGPR